MHQKKFGNGANVVEIGYMLLILVQAIISLQTENRDVWNRKRNTKSLLKASKKYVKYVSWKRDPGSVAIEAFTIEWKQYYLYAFPPFSMILKTLKKIRQEGSRGIVVVPQWYFQPWYPLFIDLLESDPIVFEPNKNLLLSSNREPHPLWTQLTLVAGSLSDKRLQ